MRLILMRHGESYNNMLAKISREDYENKRVYEPELSPVGQDSCCRMGTEVARLGVTIHRIICSPQKRAILSAKYFREKYMEKMQQDASADGEGQKQDTKNIDIHLNNKCYEFQGVHMGGVCHPGLTRTQILEQCHDIIIGEAIDQQITEKGWFTRDTLETPEEMLERQKDLIKDLKDLHRLAPDETVLMISHGAFLHGLHALLTNQQKVLFEAMVLPVNNSISIVDFVSGWNDKHQKEYLDVKLKAINVQLIEDVETIVKQKEGEEQI